MGKKIGWGAGKIVTAISAVIAEIFLYLLASTKMIPTKFMIAGGVILLLMVALVGFLTWSVKSKGRYIGGMIVAVLFIAIMGVGCRYVARTNQTTDRMTSTRVETTEVGVYVRMDDTNDFSTVAASYTYGILGELDRENTDDALAQLNEELDTTVATVEYDTITDVVDALLNKNVDAILLNKAYLDIIEEMEGYEDIMTRIREATLLVAEREVEVTLPDTVDPDDAAEANTTSFSVFISGIDTYGSVSTKSRSDVNIIATVNTETHQILLVSTPRDYFVPLSISNGKEDKLTHAGIYGIQVSMDTLEMLYGIDIDYYFRVNFTGFEDIIDALGGITVESDYAFTSYHNGYTFVKGENQMNGEQALSFARERYAFADGDNQRGKNQMAVIKGVVKKALSPELLLNYTSILDAVDGSFETSMSYDTLSTLVRNQLDDGGSWEVITYSATGTGSSAVPYSMSQTAYVMIPDEASVETAAELMTAVRNGEVITQP
jgi:LCP family protein required for cell wall assembly